MTPNCSHSQVKSYTQRLRQIDDLCQNTIHDTTQVLMAFTGATHEPKGTAQELLTPLSSSADTFHAGVRSSAPTTTEHLMTASSDDAPSSSSCTTISAVEFCESQQRHGGTTAPPVPHYNTAPIEEFCDLQVGSAVLNHARDNAVRIMAPDESCDMLLEDDALFQELLHEDFSQQAELLDLTSDVGLLDWRELPSAPSIHDVAGSSDQAAMLQRLSSIQEMCMAQLMLQRVRADIGINSSDLASQIPTLTDLNNYCRANR